jgi:hypothetical protein
MFREVIKSFWARLEVPLRRAIRAVHFPRLEFGFKIKAGLPLSIRMSMLRRGFLSQSYLVYRLDENDPSQYLTDYQMFVRTPDLNGRYRVFLHDKEIFALMTKVMPAHAVETFGIIRRGRVVHGVGDRVGNAADYLLDLLRKHPKLVIKPMTGSRGYGIRFLFRRDTEFYLNEERLSEQRLRDLIGEMDGDLVACYVEQSPEMAALYPRTVNTLRLLTMWDIEQGEPFIASAMLRIGSSSSYPVDNLSQGGVSTIVDLETGELSKGADYVRETGELTWHTHHPETRMRIEGMILPHWQQIRSNMLAFCRSMPFLRHVGWDLAITADGFKIIEGNHDPFMRNHQIHHPLLADPRVVKFYKAHGVL